MQYFLIYNKTSGNHNSVSLVKAVKQSLVQGGNRAYCISTKYKGHAGEIAKCISSRLGDKAIVIVFGGDGTVSEAAGGLVGTDTPLMVIPCGSGNDFAKKLYGKSFTANCVLEKLGLLSSKKRYIVKPIDTINANGHTCINVLSVGFDTIVETKANKLLRRLSFLGKRAYDIAVVMSLFGKRSFDYNVTAFCGDKRVDIPQSLSIILLALCNASYYGGGYCPAPNSSLNDGILDLVYVDTVSILRIAQLIGPYKNGKASGNKEIHEYRITSLIIEGVSGKVLYNCDGENYLEDNVKIKVLPNSLRLCFPE